MADGCYFYSKFYMAAGYYFIGNKRQIVMADGFNNVFFRSSNRMRCEFIICVNQLSQGSAQRSLLLCSSLSFLGLQLILGFGVIWWFICMLLGSGVQKYHNYELTFYTTQGVLISEIVMQLLVLQFYQLSCYFQFYSRFWYRV